MRSESEKAAVERLSNAVTTLEKFFEGGAAIGKNAGVANHGELNKLAQENALLKVKQEKVKKRLDTLIHSIEQQID